MPMTFDDGRVDSRLAMHELDQSGTPEEKRTRLADFIESTFGDYVEGWEIRSGRPWDQMSQEEARLLVQAHPHLSRNPGVLSILCGRR